MSRVPTSSINKVDSRHLHRLCLHLLNPHSVSVLVEQIPLGADGNESNIKKELNIHVADDTQSDSKLHINEESGTEFDMIEHVKKNNEVVHRCRVCGVESRYMSNMKRHIQRHKTGKYLQCGHCSSRFYHKHELNDHMKVHNGELWCQYCGKKFSSSRGLRDHEKRHLGEYRYTCSICGKQFMSKTVYTTHLDFHSVHIK